MPQIIVVHASDEPLPCLIFSLSLIVIIFVEQHIIIFAVINQIAYEILFFISQTLF